MNGRYEGTLKELVAIAVIVFWSSLLWLFSLSRMNFRSKLLVLLWSLSLALSSPLSIAVVLFFLLVFDFVHC
ncbi:hypothetical protein N658DRAFT_499596 [Parathielavia hyrcaniae]|uniref:Uncharacterized protein n=1 Tax=Parathielavia hyrcaniae TaxID=113614 RepID=A0AAN6PWH4_9PEZI|nr:hypothetical protein N658DRAFT_499596 [Parathielavia hyrcaniae]